MRVKVGNEWFDTENTPVAVQFTRQELEYIKSEMPIHEGDRKFAAVKGQDSDKVLAWLRDEVEI